MEDRTNADVLLSPPQSPLTPGSDWGEEQKLWLSCSAKINTDLFNGNRFRRPTATLKEDVTDLDLKREERRLNKERVVYDEEIGYYVTKESTLCKEWEAVPTSATGTVVSTETKASQMKHLKSCMICGMKKNLKMCMYCPEVYHENCVHPEGKKKPSSPMPQTICPRHRCISCKSTANDSGGLLLTCTKCPQSFCVDCADLDAIESVEEHKLFDALGYERSKHTEYIICKECNSSRSVQKRRVHERHGHHFRRVKRRV